MILETNSVLETYVCAISPLHYSTHIDSREGVATYNGHTRRGGAGPAEGGGWRLDVALQMGGASL